MEIKKFINPIARENTYVLRSEQACAVIDPGSDVERVIEYLREVNLPVLAILLTHAHFDHILGLEQLKTAFPEALIYLHRAEKDWFQKPILNASRLLLGRDVAVNCEADRFYEVGKTYDLAGLKFYILETPGHSAGGVSLVFPEEQVVFSGDALFYEAIGRWDLPTGNHQVLLRSITENLFRLAPKYKVYPGHMRSTTIAHEREFNPYVRA